MQIPYEEGKVYHIYNRTNGKERLFLEERNYHFFLNKYSFYTNSFVDTYAICLIPNHFHAMIRIKALSDIEQKAGLKTISKYNDFSLMISHQFSRLFSCFSQAFNKVYYRHGSLFQPKMKRKLVERDDYFTSLALYIHQNPLKHGLVKNLYDWPYNSIHYYRSQSHLFEKLITDSHLIDWFGGTESLLKQHETYKGLKSAFE
ncbi:MAG: transposase [Cyclobacteriaceae bacterium]